MTREEGIKVSALKYLDDFNPDVCGICNEDIYDAFMAGVLFADNNPKSPWISVKEDLPYNHKELLLSTGCHTVGVFTYIKGGACGIDNMIIRNGKWEWEAWKENYLYWMPIPNLPKE